MTPKITGATSTQYPNQQAQTFGNSQVPAPSRLPTPIKSSRPLPTPPKKINAQPVFAQRTNDSVRMPSPYTAPVMTHPAPTKPIETKPAQNQQTTNLVFPGSSNNFSAAASIPVSTRPIAVAPRAPRHAPPASIKPPMVVTHPYNFSYPTPEKEAAVIANSRACKQKADGQEPDSWSGDLYNLRDARQKLPNNWNQIGWNPEKSQEHLTYALGKIDATITSTESFKASWLYNPLSTIEDVREYETDKSYLINELDFTFDFINYLNELKVGKNSTLPSEPDCTYTKINLIRNPVKVKPPLEVIREKGTRDSKGVKYRDGGIVKFSNTDGKVNDLYATVRLVSKKELTKLVDKQNRELYQERIVCKGYKTSDGKKVHNGDIVYYDENGNNIPYFMKVMNKKEFTEIVTKAYEKQQMIELVPHYQTILQDINDAIDYLPHNWLSEEIKNELLPAYLAFIISNANEIQQFINDLPNLTQNCKNPELDFTTRNTKCYEQVVQINTLLKAIQEFKA